MRFFNSKLFFWGLLSVPALPIFWQLAAQSPGPDGEPVAEFLLHPTGETSARLMIAAMALSPLRLMFPGSNALRWLINRRRYLGLGAFAYAALHTVFYLVDMASVEAVLGEFFALGIWTGWFAILFLLPLALTSNDLSVRRLGWRWKALQRFIYAAAVLVLLHWIFVHNNQAAALAHFLPLFALETYRIWHLFFRRRKAF
ncbi:MAG: ferric reductase-like transmembrane domain-containing protein [Paracoccaceae bacterium]|nr:ferric reductase-like transmembrane domain-containing protein [Paracoccaceae bacterium]